MSERKYSYGEIEAMRQALTWDYPSGVGFYPEERTKEIEERIRTLMVGGVDPQEVLDQVQKNQAQRQKAELGYAAALAAQRAQLADK
jgi:ABC-type glycerol-3-phosphate transport system substrate-binding protein